mmetsp:Transcript_15108/g.64694  ORF Transcript_15108/g.64694 Transcript_15108/m.64694 type:complete len:400 (-) Transcript_15108:1333-2532(-)
MERPSLTASTMEEKLSSAKTISDASFATAVPVMPMAMPMSASFSAGASLTPSPVIATISPCSLSNRTMSCLCLGSAREHTTPPGDWSSAICFFLGSDANSRPVNERFLESDGFWKIPMSRQIASAVSWLSPVITTTLIPALAHSATAPATSGRGGSRKPAKPTNVSSDSIASYDDGSFNKAWPGCPTLPSYVSSTPRSLPDFTANPNTRSAVLDIAVVWSTICFFAAGESGATDPSGICIFAHRSSTFSGAPLTNSAFVPFEPAAALVFFVPRTVFEAPAEKVAFEVRTTTDIDFLPRSNSRTARRCASRAIASLTAAHEDSGDARRSSTMRDISASFSTPSFSARTLSAPSVGSPEHLNPPSPADSTTASLQEAQILASVARLASSFVSPTTPPSLGS